MALIHFLAASAMRCVNPDDFERLIKMAPSFKRIVPIIGMFQASFIMKRNGIFDFLAAIIPTKKSQLLV